MKLNDLIRDTLSSQSELLSILSEVAQPPSPMRSGTECARLAWRVLPGRHDSNPAARSCWRHSSGARRRVFNSTSLPPALSALRDSRSMSLPGARTLTLRPYLSGTPCRTGLRSESGCPGQGSCWRVRRVPSCGSPRSDAQLRRSDVEDRDSILTCSRCGTPSSMYRSSGHCPDSWHADCGPERVADGAGAATAV